MDKYIGSKFIICILKCIVLLPPPLPRDKERERERNKIAIQKKNENKFWYTISDV